MPTTPDDDRVWIRVDLTHEQVNKLRERADSDHRSVRGTLRWLIASYTAEPSEAQRRAA